MIKKTIVVLFVSLAAKGYSQPFFTLKDAINTSLKVNYNIQLAKNSVSIATINNDKGMAGALPTVIGTAADNEQLQSINQTYTDPSKDVKRNNVGANALTAGITGSILLYNGMRVMATEKRLALLQQQSSTSLNQQIQSLIADVSIQYYDVIRQQGYLKTILQSIDASQEKLTILKIRREIGVANDADIFQAQLDLNALKQQQLSQELVIKQSKLNLLNTININPDKAINIKDTILIDTDIKQATIQKEIEKNPSIIAATQQVAINKLMEKETAALRYPSLKANTGYNFSNSKSAAGFSLLNQTYGPFVGLSLSVPIYNGSVYKRQQEIAALNTKNAVLQRESLVLNNQSSLANNYEAYTSTLEQLKKEEENTALSTKLLSLVMQKFQLGQATIIDVKLAQQSFESESYRLINLSYAAKLAEINLKQLANQLTF